MSSPLHKQMRDSKTDHTVSQDTRIYQRTCSSSYEPFYTTYIQRNKAWGVISDLKELGLIETDQVRDLNTHSG